jgi:ABC-type phosphate transport system substrate-binding protein
MMRKNMMSVLVILTLLGAAFAGCTGDDDTTTDTTTDNTGTNDATTDTTTDESYVINIAGSSTVFPVASLGSSLRCSQLKLQCSSSWRRIRCGCK